MSLLSLKKSKPSAKTTLHSVDAFIDDAISYAAGVQVLGQEEIAQAKHRHIEGRSTDTNPVHLKSVDATYVQNESSSSIQGHIQRQLKTKQKPDAKAGERANEKANEKATAKETQHTDKPIFQGKNTYLGMRHATFTLTPECISQLSLLSQDSGIPKSALIRKWITREFEERRVIKDSKN
ncbi:MAG: hypothetical protein CL600_08120 [Alteromonas sp.]|jgi:hypothetical protein|uniref:hypothetical protein n=1 Tax=Alteromonas sp. MB-3u-76 TaxID=2058133 RepID=UPI000C30E9BF|nr:hypothetical protein [Alteromonas sp. MB-3u-76]AUC89280.1 hypothetical protein CW735_14705 [Alteromonas sp. MB-3u-76]MAI64825.1 hypothetical protein [Alteromonas sp.]